MGRNWAITIGINGYRNLQRLNYAKRDAEAMQLFLQQELNIQTVYHFSDNSPPIPQDYGPPLDSSPTYATLRRFFRIRFEEPFLRPGDNLWLFFAGHGKRHEDRDYLMPIDADPGDEAEKSTWIPLSYVTERLRRSGADNIVMLIDACRSGSGRRDSSGFGQENQQGVITLFACSPWESSYEIEELQQGAFTHALLQGLQIEGEGNCATVERLYQRLRQTVPQVTQQYKRVQQTPYGVVEPPTKYHLILLPRKANLADIDTLKLDAQRAELRQDAKLAKQLWIRVLAASPADYDAIEGIERLARVSAMPATITEEGILSPATGQRETKSSPSNLIADTPVQLSPSPSKSSSVRLIPSQSKQPTSDLLLIDPAIASQWKELPQNVWVHEGTTLASLKIEDLRTGRMIWKDVRWIEPSQLFVPELAFIDHRSGALPGALMPEERQPLTLAGERITPLIPLNPLLLEYLTPEELHNRVKFHSVSGGQEPIVQVILDLPLTGTKEGRESTNYRLTKEYLLKKENALSEVPVLDVWPNFRASQWKEYYAFYYDGEYGKETFQVEFPESQEVSLFKDVRGGNYQTVRLKQFPSVIECRDEAKTLLGLILLEQPPEVNPNDSWQVGVDFGTSFTNVYINRKGMVELLTLESLNLKVTDAPLDIRFSVLFEYFIPENFIPQERPLPLWSVLTTLGSGQATLSQNGRPIFDGRMYIPNLARFDPKANWIQTDLKWTNFSANRLFLKHLALHISAIAVKNGINQIQWSLSFPSAFSRNDCNRYVKTWWDLTQDLQRKTGITYQCPYGLDSDYLRTESLSIAQYFADFEGHDLVVATCIDMGGGTSDISVWERNKLIHQCSVQLAGRDLLSHFLELKLNFIEKYFKVNTKEWQGLRGEGFHTKLTGLLRWESERWLKDERPTLLNEEFQGLIQLMMLGWAGLYFYVGTLLRVLYDEDKCKRGEITPVYIGGNGSRLLHWLDSSGRFTHDSEINDLLSYMLSRGSGFKDTEVPTWLSQNPKDEVACGLVLDNSKLEGLKRKTKDPVIAGETCELNGVKVFWNSRLDIEEDVQSFRMPSFDRLSEFLYEFHVALKELRIEEIRPLKGYKPSKTISDNDKLWSGTQRSLETVLETVHLSGQAGRIRVEPPFILGLKALLHHLGNEWALRVDP